MNKIDESHTKDICKVGHGDKCCAYLVMGSGGFECAKGTGMALSIELRLAEGTMNAKGDNCPGIIKPDQENDMTHTPGPWTINKAKGGRSSQYAVEKDGAEWIITDLKSADAYTLNIVGADGQSVTFISNNEEPMHRPVQEANARLIAAAPKLLEACKLALEEIGAENKYRGITLESGGGTRAHYALEEAIAHATKEK